MYPSYSNLTSTVLDEKLAWNDKVFPTIYAERIVYSITCEPLYLRRSVDTIDRLQGNIKARSIADNLHSTRMVRVIICIRSQGSSYR